MLTDTLNTQCVLFPQQFRGELQSRAPFLFVNSSFNFWRLIGSDPLRPLHSLPFVVTPSCGVRSSSGRVCKPTGVCVAASLDIHGRINSPSHKCWNLWLTTHSVTLCAGGMAFGYSICYHVKYLVDPASSHMLVSKIKPCMSKYKLLYTVKLRMAH